MINLLENKNLLIGIAVALILYFWIKSSPKKDKEFEKEYREILYSDKYKAKGQYD